MSKPISVQVVQGTLLLKAILTIVTLVALFASPDPHRLLEGWTKALPPEDATNVAYLFGRELLPTIGSIWGVFAIKNREKNQLLIALCLSAMSITLPLGMQDSPVVALGLMAVALLSRGF